MLKYIIMKRAISAVLISILISTPVLAQTDYEKKLEYNRKKIQILIKTAMKNESSGYSDTDTWSTTISPEAGYSYTYTTGSTRTGSTTLLREISDWVIVRGGIRELSDMEFLKIVGDTETARRVQDEINERNKWRLIGTIGGLIGIGVAVSGSSDGSVGTITAGSVISLIGFLVSSLNFPKKHYIPADYALEQKDFYNIGLKRELGLPIDYD